ncbi:hypothetical protein F4679DRAFT_551566 [Xylaria curta]|nr:hypothetical protein F4679DRAFT_551566 [Xylaria curta]
MKVMAGEAGIHLSFEELLGETSLFGLMTLGKDRLAYCLGICTLLQLYQQLSQGTWP